MGRSKKKNRLQTSFQAEIDTYNSILGKAAKIVAIVPRIQELKEEAEAKLFAASVIPEDLLDEITPHLLMNQEWDYKPIKLLDQSLPSIEQRYLSQSSTSGTSVAITTTISRAFTTPESRPEWATQVIDRFSEIADLKSKRDSLPQAISALSSELGEEFIRAEESIRKAKADILQPHQAAASMRNVIQQVWGELVENARPLLDRSHAQHRFELKKPSHRAEISHAIAPSQDQSMLEYRLEELFGVYQDLSRLSKKTGTPPLKLLHELRTRWILSLDALRPFYKHEKPAAG